MTLEIEKLIDECEWRGLRLEPRGGQLLVAPQEKATPSLVEQLRQHKQEIIASLEQRRRTIWLHTAKQILCGEFVGCNAATRLKLNAGLRSVPHPSCRRALKRLQSEK